MILTGSPSVKESGVIVYEVPEDAGNFSEELREDGMSRETLVKASTVNAKLLTFLKEVEKLVYNKRAK